MGVKIMVDLKTLFNELLKDERIEKNTPRDCSLLNYKIGNWTSETASLSNAFLGVAF